MAKWKRGDGASTRGTTIVLAAIPALGALSLAAIILFSARELLVKTAVSTAAQHARVMASHTEQSFKAVQLLLEVLAIDLRGRDLHAIPESRGREMLRTRMSGALAQVRNMSIMDGEGRQLFLSTETIVGKVSAASHDLRQPFQAMMLYKDILDGRLTLPEHRKVLAGLSTAMEGGQELLNALLHISTLEAGGVDLRVAAIPLGDMLGALAAEFADQAARRGLRLSVVPCSVVVVTDPVLFRRMMRNLLVNALKYTTRGRVLLGARRRGGAVRVEVWDTGPGIPADRQEEIWEEFSQLHNPERDRAKGLGLGLAIVARTGQLLRHQVSVRSWPGRGSVFRVAVPVQERAAG